MLAVSFLALQAWFHATVRQDVTAGITTRAELRRRDPQLAAVMEEVWGNGSWKYPDTAPKKFKGYRRERRLLAALCGFKGMSIQEKP